MSSHEGEGPPGSGRGGDAAGAELQPAPAVAGLSGMTEELIDVVPDGDILASREAGGRFLRGGGMRMGAYAAGLAVGLIATPLVTRHLGTVGWGHYVTVTSLIFIAAALTEGGVANLGVRQFSTTGDRERRAFMSDLLGLRLVLSLLGALGAVVFALVAGYQSVLVEGAAIASLGLLLEGARVTLAVPLTAKLRLGWLAVTDFSAQAVTSVLMIALVVSGAALLPFYAVAVITAATTLALTVALVRSEVSLRPSFSPSPLARSDLRIVRLHGSHDARGHLLPDRDHRHVADLDEASDRIFQPRLPGAQPHQRGPLAAGRLGLSDPRPGCAR